MSQENVEIVRRAFEAYLAGDVETAIASLDPGIVYKRAEEAAVHGPDQVRAGWEEWEADWEDLQTIPEEYLDAGDHVLVTLLFRGRGRASGVEVEGRYYEVLTLRDGKAIHWEEFSERSAALKAAGLSE